jgi:heme-degrading monooxygenase HmoA
MIRHSVILKLKKEISTDQKKSFFEAVDKLVEIPKVLKFEVLKQTSSTNPFEYGISMEFESQEDYDNYSNHPMHQEFIQKNWLPCVEDFLEIDYVPFL